MTRNGLATLKGSPPGCRYQFRRRRIGLEKHINTYYDFGGKFHPHLQRIGNTELRKGSPPVGGRYQFLKLQCPVPLLS